MFDSGGLREESGRRINSNSIRYSSEKGNLERQFNRVGEGMGINGRCRVEG